ncbi:MAG: hypothetical protein WA056_15440 [Gallionella sp.]
MTDENNRSIEIAELADRVHAELKPGLDEKLQYELATLLGLFPRLANSSDPILPKLAKIATSALLSESPNLNLAKKLRERLEGRLNLESNLVLAAIRGKSPAVRVVLGLGVLLYFVIPLLVLSSVWLKDFRTIFGIEVEMLGLVAFSGALGSIVSIMVRLHQFADAKSSDHAIEFFTGLFKPIVGSAFALFIFVVLSSGLIPIAIQTEKALYFFAALSFVAGFSERFAQDIVTKTETAVTQGPAEKTS